MKKVNESIKNRIFIGIMNLFEYEEKDHYKLVRLGNSFKNWSNNYIEYESKVDRNKTLLVEKYLNQIKPYLKDIINNLKKHVENSLDNSN